MNRSEANEKAKQHISNAGFGTGTNITTHALKCMMVDFYLDNQVKNLGIASVVDSKPEIKAALNHAVSAIYFNDNSDYLIGLYGTVRSLTGLEAPTDEDITNLFKKLNPE
jgi:hypothetical protein